MDKIVTVAKKQNNYAYAIRRIADGKFGRGGTGPAWGKLPKVWTKGAFKNHLHLFGPRLYEMTSTLDDNYPWRTYSAGDFAVGLIDKRRFPYVGCEVVVLDTTSEAHNMTTVATYPAAQWIWEKVYRPLVLSQNYHSDRIHAFAQKHGIDLKAPDTIDDDVKPSESNALDDGWYHFEVKLKLDGASHFPDEIAILKAFKELTGSTTITSRSMILRKN